MALEDVLKQIKDKFGASISDVAEVAPNQAFVTVSPENVVEVVRGMFEGMGGRLATCTALDERDCVEVLYHFCFDSEKCTITLKAAAKKPHPVLDSVAPYIPGAENIEKEMHDLLGVDFKNHPGMKRFILADDWPEGVYPLRRDYSK